MEIQLKHFNPFFSDITLITDTATFGVTATDMPYVTTWDDEDVEPMVNQWLIQFEV